MHRIKNTELIQSLIRMAIGTLTYVYISLGINNGHFDVRPETLTTFTLVFFSFSLLVLASIYFIPESTPRRYSGLLFDITDRKSVV